MVPSIVKQRVHFGPFELDAHAGELYKHGLKLKLQGHPVQILAVLVERPGELITREEIQQRLWPSESETFVDFEHGLNTAVRKLRQALGDEAETPPYIETLPRRGYRFVGAIIAEEVDEAPAAELPVPTADSVKAEAAPKVVESAISAEAAPSTLLKEVHRKRLWLRAVLAVVLVLALIAGGVGLLRFARRAPGGLTVTATRQLTYLGGVGANSRILTDRRRIYFTTGNENPLQYVSVNGGEPSSIPIPLSRWAQTLHISRDGAYLLVNELYGPRGGIQSPIWIVDVNGGAARRVGDVDARDAAFAPDGKTIVVAKGRELYLTDLQGARPVKLTEAPGYIFSPRWSPDGQRLRFTVWDGVTNTANLWELSRGCVLRQLFPGWKKAYWVCCGEWTADGQYYLFRGAGQPGG
ncbi:MAG TPA: winged helix-turn-helix domain-containing protein [Candidatus Eisenbacteria bacterium]|nr:winged helix-turn-helix domain-containing protein [Candidatus Eisenbacteria bacterium]